MWRSYIKLDPYELEELISRISVGKKRRLPSAKELVSCPRKEEEEEGDELRRALRAVAQSSGRTLSMRKLVFCKNNRLGHYLRPRLQDISMSS